MDGHDKLPLWLQWVGANAFAEAVGLGLTLAVDFVIISRTAAAQNAVITLAVVALVAASGAIEGAIVGFLQWAVLRRVFPSVSRRVWVSATVAGAVAAWFFGSLPSTLIDMSAQGSGAVVQEPETATVLMFAAVLGAFLGLVLGYPQWRVLRRAVDGAWLWIPANCIAWALGMPVVFAATDIAQRSASLEGALAILGISLLVTGAIVGAVHGFALVWLAAQEQVRAGATAL